MQLHIDPISTKAFFYSAKDKKFTAEASDLRGFRLERLTDDACDEGVALKSHKTGAVTRWYMAEEVRDPRENELQAWAFTPTGDTVKQYPALHGHTLVIFND